MIRALLLVCAFALTACAESPAQVQSNAAIASAHPLATAAGYEILEVGGNAFDAAVAVAAALSVVEPYSSGLGGGGFYLLHRAHDGHEIFIDAREMAPSASTADMYLDDEGEPVFARMREGPLAAGIPGVPAAMVHLAHEYGALPLAKSLAPAVRLAEEGFAADERLVVITRRSAPLLQRHGTEAFFIDGRPPEVGEVLRQPELAATLRELGEDHGESFYRGETARRLVVGVREAGGIWDAEDLAAYRVALRDPLVGEYRGYRIVTAPPPSSGGVVLLTTLNILSGFDTDNQTPVERAHVLVEAWRRAYRDRGDYIGDPDYIDVPVSRLVSTEHAGALRSSIDLRRASRSSELPSGRVQDSGPSTTHFSIIDREGNRVAATQTVNFRYGSGLMPAGTGVVLNNEMFDFAARPGSPDGFDLVSQEVNLIGPRKRPVSSMTPTFVEGPRGVAVLGTPGGSRIITMVTLALLEWVDGRSADEIVAAPRFHHQYLPDVVSAESGMDLTGLEALGHETRVLPRRYGNMNIVTWDRASGVATAATDPRNQSLTDY